MSLHVEQAWSIEDLLFGQRITPKNFAFARTIFQPKALFSAIPAGQKGSICFMTLQ